jgi:hypothetical protein
MPNLQLSLDMANPNKLRFAPFEFSCVSDLDMKQISQESVHGEIFI